ncbi:protein ELC-like [Nymphaea colorata]|nr:protein ELC-like [Nymphaea colorata]
MDTFIGRGEAYCDVRMDTLKRRSDDYCDSRMDTVIGHYMDTLIGRGDAHCDPRMDTFIERSDAYCDPRMDTLIEYYMDMLFGRCDVYCDPRMETLMERGDTDCDPRMETHIERGDAYCDPRIDMARNISLLFGRDPPLCTTQPAPVVHRIQNQYQGSASSTTVRRPSSPSPSSSASDHPPPSVRPSNVAPPTPPYGRTVPPSPQRPNSDDPSEVLKKKLLEMLHSDTVALRKSREAETDSVVRAQRELKRRGRQIDEGLRQMMDEKEGLEQLLQKVLMNTDLLGTWLREKGEKNMLVIDDDEGRTQDFHGRMKQFNSRFGWARIKHNVFFFLFSWLGWGHGPSGPPPLSAPDDVFEPCDPLSRQMLECIAFDRAIEDTFYSLDEAMRQGVIPFDAYMRNIRALSREQFLHRATSAKVMAAQMQSVITSMASRATPYGV